ncbi:alpha/beta fold hydrolase [Acidipropionibacterium virtanenii]|uniref:AB hydrolase-1 domain-containing protein n=1 Tax=Acidipropionibacterium virtanenii TaxID=2057246 RepID=A0A344UQR4_9ACTN|nr:alpha/beta hydrolase [Acidipropionibacterium virtanenii]AXE37612.1 hypothetical protein JS278_00418 [Acidipropionibacterium virtanenii]
MQVILVPGLWLDASSWQAVIPALEAAGHTARPLTMPGTGQPAARSGAIHIQDWVDAVVAEIDAAALHGPVVLVGHSGGGNVVWAAADARPGAVARVVFVDTVPPAPGDSISEFEAVDGVIPFPGWDFFGEDAADLDTDVRSRTEATTGSIPVHVPTDPISHSTGRRREIPVTLLMGRLDADGLRAELASWPGTAAEFDAIADVEVVTLGTGHWPQFSSPGVLAPALVQAVH